MKYEGHKEATAIFEKAKEELKAAGYTPSCKTGVEFIDNTDNNGKHSKFTATLEITLYESGDPSCS